MKHRPLFQRPDTDTPYDHVQVEVDGAAWTMLSDLPAGAGSYYRLDPVAGEISFGDFDPATQTGHGSIPVAGAQIVATSYRYVAGGASGNVGGASVTSLATPVAGITAVTNPSSSFGGSDEEPIEETLRRAPEELKVRNRAVTLEDYEYLAREATTDVKIVRCLAPQWHETADPPYAEGEPWTFGGMDRSAGCVNLIVLPDADLDVPRPQPSKDLLREVTAYLDARRDLTAKLAIVGPCYLPVKVVVNATVWSKAIAQGLISGPADLESEIQSRLQTYLHPVRGGLDGQGWQPGQHVFIADLFKAIMPAENIGFISSLTLEAEPPDYSPPARPFQLATPGAWVRVADYETVCFGASSTVTVGMV